MALGGLRLWNSGYEGSSVTRIAAHRHVAVGRVVQSTTYEPPETGVDGWVDLRTVSFARVFEREKHH